MSGFVGVIRVLTTSNPHLLAAHGRQIEQRFGLATRTKCIPDQPQGIFSDETERQALPKILQVGREMAADGAEAIVVSCAADPAVPELRAELKIPVIGAGSAASAVALGLAHHVGVLNLTEGAPGPVRRLLGESFVGEDNPKRVKNTIDLMTDWGKDAAIEAARGLVEAGAGALVLACTGYATIGMAAELRRRMGIIAVDPVDAAGLMVWYAVGRPSQG